MCFMCERVFVGVLYASVLTDNRSCDVVSFLVSSSTSHQNGQQQSVDGWLKGGAVVFVMFRLILSERAYVYVGGWVYAIGWVWVDG